MPISQIRTWCSERGSDIPKSHSKYAQNQSEKSGLLRTRLAQCLPPYAPKRKGKRKRKGGGNSLTAHPQMNG